MKGLKPEVIDPEKVNQAIYEMGEQEGRREVVKWIKSREVNTDILGAVRFYASREEWQAKLKEWGI